MQYELALFHAPGIGHKRFHLINDFIQAQALNLEDLFKNPLLLRELLKQQSQDPKQGENTIEKFQLDKLTQDIIENLEAYFKHYQSAQLENELSWSQQANQQIISINDQCYPPLLKQLPIAPPILYILGEPKLLAKVQLAIVGSRNPSHAGNETAYYFAKELSEAGLVITSGMAIGIDGASHQGALEGQGQTIAIAGTGLDRIYPSRHQELAHKIAENGALVSCFPLGTRPAKGNFPKRNQLIAGLSIGTLVIEAAIKSGSLITARLAMEYGREVFAILGSIHNPLARGCHALIKDGAKLVDCIDDISQEIINLSHINQAEVAHSTIASFEPDNSTHQKNASFQNKKTSTETNIFEKLTKQQQTLIDSMAYNETLSLDHLAQRTGISIEYINAEIILLELQALVRQEPGGKITRLKK